MRVYLVIPTLLIAAVTQLSAQTTIEHQLAVQTQMPRPALMFGKLADEIIPIRDWQDIELPTNKAANNDQVPQDPQRDVPPVIQIALLLDTSNSMDGLINQARSQLWAIVNSLDQMTRNGQRATLQVALYEYGQSSISVGEQHLRQVLPFSTDLDTVSEKLFALTTNGGDEFCGAVIRAASRGLSWSTKPTDLKIMIVAGNEPFTQGLVDFRPAVIDAANGRGIIINTIFCGGRDEGVSGQWQTGATLGGGSFNAINQNRSVVEIATPQDQELARLGLLINDTYIPYGVIGQAGAARQVEQDANAAKLSAGSFASRAGSKASSAYCNDHWDLCDAYTNKKVDLAKLQQDQLPPVLRELTPEQREAYIAGKIAERKRIQDRIQELSKERAAFLAAHRNKGEKALDDAIIADITAQAQRAGFVKQ